MVRLNKFRSVSTLFKETAAKNRMLWITLAVMTAAFILQYYGDILRMTGRWDNEDFSYCYLVPLLFAYLIFTGRESLKAVDVKSSWYGLPVIIFSCMIYLAGNMGSVETLGAISIWITVTGTTLLILGPAVIRKLVFPFIILAFIVPLPPFINKLLTFKLKLASSSISVKLMQMTGISVFREGNIIDLGVTQLQVVDACSGLRYVYPLLLMGFVFAYLFHKKWWQRTLVILATIPVSVLSNALRIAITGYLTVNISREMADGFFHGFSGWLIFMFSFIVLFFISKLIKFLSRKAGTVQQHKVTDEKKKIRTFDMSNVKIFYVLISILISISAWGFKTSLAASQVIPGRESFKSFPEQIGDWAGKKSYLSRDVLDSLWADDYVQIYYINIKTGDRLLLFIPYYEYQGSRHTAHAPESCLIGSGYAPKQRDIIKKEFPEPFGKVLIGRMVLEKDDQRLLSNYWFQMRGRIISNAWVNKWFLLRDAIIKRRTDGALVRIEMPVRGTRSVEEAQQIMDSFTGELMKILPVYIPE